MGNLNKSIYLIAVTAFAFFIVNEVFSFSLESEKEEQTIYQKDANILHNLMKAQLENVKILSDLLAKNEFVIKGYESNDPELIKKHIGPIWEQVRNDKLTYEIHFFKPPAISFVNFSNFKSIGQDVSDIRTDIQWVTTSFKPSTHILMCKTYAGLRATNPITDKKGKILGGLSLGKKIDWLPAALKENSKHDSFLVYTKNSTNTLVNKYYDQFIQDKEIIGNYILADKTLNINSDTIKKIDFSKDIQTLEINGTKFYLNTYKIIDFNKEIMGYIVTLSTLDDFYKKFETHILKSFILILGTAFIIFFLTRRSYFQMLKKIKFMENLTNKIKKNSFKELHSMVLQKDEGHLGDLQNNIIVMGLEIEKSYNILHEKNKEKDQKIFKQFYYDTLTKLPNRNKLFEDLKIDQESYITLLDIKNFKQINDIFGFQTGNEVLRQITNTTLQNIENQNYNVYRIGGDRFIIKNNIIQTQDQFIDFLKKIIYAIEHDTIHTNDNVSVSIELYAGVCFELEDKLAKAEIALTKSKKTNKDFVIYTQDDEEKILQTQNINMINKIKEAIENDHILVYFQGIVDKEEKINKYEALVRLQDGDQVLSPYYFLEVAQKTKYYPSITKLVIQKTFQKFRDTDLMFSINLSASDILNENTSLFIKDQLRICKNAKNAVFEILETEEIYNLQEIEDFIKEIKLLGAKIAIDDFGTGYSNFSYLLNINPDFIKIDGSLIKNIDVDVRAQKVVKSIITFARESNITTIAEFVHSKEIFNVCRSLGIDQFQGYLFSDPSPEIIMN